MRASAALVALAACGDNRAGALDAALDPRARDAATDARALDAFADHDAPNTLEPLALADTGLCLDAACTQISPDVHAYTPRFRLWSDGATKRRWIYLPPGTQIDTSDMDYWKFPVGTKVWKEFTRDGVRVETRYMAKVADEATANQNAWYYVAYAWNAAQDAAIALPQGAQNVLGTAHDIPSRSVCRGCHENLEGPDQARGRVLGVGAIQLDAPAAPGELDLAGLVAANLLTANPPAPATAGEPYFSLAGLTAHEQAAFGYLHANCGHCHNSTSFVYTSVPMQLRLLTSAGARAAGTATPAYTSTVAVEEHVAYGGLPAHALIVAPHAPALSVLHQRMVDTSGQYHMPALGSEVVDPDGPSTIAAWIGDLP